MTTIDADAHVIETPQTWSYMRDDEQDFRPQIFIRDIEDGAPVRSNMRKEFWVIEGRLQSKGSNVGKDVSREAGTLADISARLAHMDETGVDVQVLFPSLFLRPLTREPDLEFALVCSYNRWLAEIWGKSSGRLRWVALPPLASLVDRGLVREELEFCKAHGACGIFMRGIEQERLLNQRYFFPLYAMAQDLDLPLCLHAGLDSFGYHAMLQPASSLMTFKFPVIGAFESLIEDEIPKRFPGCRWAFIEASAQWVPYALNEARLRLAGKGRRMELGDMLRENRFYVTTQWSDDINGLLTALGDENLIIGTDYGHRDTATEVLAIRRMSEDGTLPHASVKRILEDNPAALYGVGV